MTRAPRFRVTATPTPATGRLLLGREALAARESSIAASNFAEIGGAVTRIPPRRDTGRAMSQQNLEVVQRFADHWNRTGEPLWSEMDPEVVFVIDPGSFVAGTYRGRDGIRTLLRLTADVFDEFQYEFDEFVDAGDAVLALGRIRARGAQSGAVGTQPGAVVFRFSNGRIVLYRSYLRREEALEAVGLRE